MRRVRRMATKPENAASSNDLFEWLETVDPYIPDITSTPPRRPHPESTRKGARRFRMTICDDNGVFGIE